MATIDLPHGTLHLGPDGCARAAASDAHVQASAVTLPGAYGWLTNHQPPHELIDGWISTYLVDRDVRRDTRRLIAALGDDAFMGQIAAEVAGFTKPVLADLGGRRQVLPPGACPAAGRHHSERPPGADRRQPNLGDA